MTATVHVGTKMLKTPNLANDCFQSANIFSIQSFKKYISFKDLSLFDQNYIGNFCFRVESNGYITSYPEEIRKFLNIVSKTTG